MATPSDRQNLQRALLLHQAGRLNEAGAIYRQVVKSDPKNAEALHYLGVVEASAGNFAEAKQLMGRSVALQPVNVQFLENFATVLFRTGDYEDALAQSERALRQNANSATFLYVSALALFKLNRCGEALARFDQLIAKQPNNVEAVNERGSVLAELKRHDEALAAFDRALSLQPQYAPAYLNRGNLFGARKRYDEAFAAYDRALAIDPRLAEAWLGRGNILRELKRHEEAFAAYERALNLRPNLAEAWFGRGNALREARRLDEALASYDRALSLNANFAEASIGRGHVLNEMSRHDDALASFQKAIDLDEKSAAAWFDHGNTLRKLGRPDQSIEDFDKALTIDPKLAYAEAARFFVRAQLCDWRDYVADALHLASAVRNSIPAAPFQLLCGPFSSQDRLQAARVFAADNYPITKPIWGGERYKHDRVRVAYVSSDLRGEHPVGQLLAGLFERHDRAHFEVTAIALGPSHESPVRDRIKGAVEHFIETDAMSDQRIAELIREREIDIAVDLNGYTEGSRQAVFARRPAPVQVNYLGFACTMGSAAFDYIVADPVAIDGHQRQSYSEKVVWLPGSFMVQDSKREISERISTRADSKLPEKGFVFCCFNNAYKYAPDMFRVWMRLLQAVEGSVLWLSQTNATAAASLRRAAQAAGVAPERLIFADRVPHQADHLARQRLADLFLDTLPYNAHATAADALWGGLPVLTCLGETFAGRVAASLLNAVGLPELITKSLEEYEALALKIARDPTLTVSLKEKLARNRTTCALFDTGRFARNIETAYVTMYERYQAGLPPEHFAVEEKA